ncbi:MAG: bifunctional diguanylate cyclase/phosphodiesterase [Dissulfuribacterales bacterium]
MLTNSNIRVKWHVESNCIKTEWCTPLSSTSQTVLDILDQDCLDTYFQPICSLIDGSVFGYESLARLANNPSTNICQIFRNAIVTRTIIFLDMRCRENAVKKASELGLANRSNLLFINTAPDVLTDDAHSVKMACDMVKKYGFKNEQVVIEITEEGNGHNCQFMKRVIQEYKDAGFKIAIDDFGAGYGGLAMLSNIEPDFIKIDRQFISDIDKAAIKYNLVDSIVTLCHRLGIKVIAEGIERDEELKIVQSMGIEFGQGYLLGRPASTFNFNAVPIPKRHNISKSTREISTIFDITEYVEPLTPDTNIFEAQRRFFQDKRLQMIPVIENSRIIGIIQRNRFLENKLIGNFGFGMHINAKKKIKQLMEVPSMIVEADLYIEEVAQRINGREFELLYDDICVTSHGKYVGTVTIAKLLHTITEQNIRLAKNQNPLTGLPGNDAIRKVIQKKIDQHIHFDIHFDVCYIDINHFKPYNDHYGFEKGDLVIQTLAQILVDSVAYSEHEQFNFIGHIGGDDFILMLHPKDSLNISAKIIDKMEKELITFHGEEDFQKGYYVSKNRKNETEIFPLLSIAIAIVSTEVTCITSYAHLASVAAEVKKAAKQKAYQTKKSAICRDRRLNG